jgi:polar amino acid transport system substrate-binding protein
MKWVVLRWLSMLVLAVGTSGAAARELRITFSQYTPPYVLDDNAGVVPDLVRMALASAGHTVKPIYAPLGRGLKMFSEGAADGTTIIQESSGATGHYSADFIEFRNRAIALKSRGFSIHSEADLADKSVIAFQQASHYLGPAFETMAKANAAYREMAQQDAQVQMLMLGRTDVVVMEESIFRYYFAQLVSEGKARRSQEVEVFEIFPPTPYKVAFKDPAVRDAFDRAIAAMRRDGRYDAIYRKYLGQSPGKRK